MSSDAMGRTGERPGVTVHGGWIEYDDVPGDNTLAPLVLLHEGLGSVGLWRGLHRTLAAATGRRTVAYSRLGHGFSDGPSAPRAPEFMHHEARAVLPELLAHWGIERPVLVGHSDGASIALLYAAEHPVTGVVVLAPHLFVEDRSVSSIGEIREKYRDKLRSRMARHHRDVDLTFYLWNDIWLAPEFASWNIEREVAAIRAPLLAIQGEDDEYGTLAQIEAIERLVPGTEKLVLPGGHWPQKDHTDHVVAALTEFAGRLPG